MDLLGPLEERDVVESFRRVNSGDKSDWGDVLLCAMAHIQLLASNVEQADYWVDTLFKNTWNSVTCTSL